MVLVWYGEENCERCAFAILLPPQFNFDNVVSPKGCLWHYQNTKRSAVLPGEIYYTPHPTLKPFISSKERND